MFKEPAGNDNEIYENMALPFMLEQSGVRGRFVRLSTAVDKILTGHKYPEAVSRLLGEMMIVVALIGTTIKARGIVSIQAQGNGLIQFIVADYTSEGHLRGYAGLREGATDAEKKLLETTDLPLNQLLGNGHIAINIDDEMSGERYQGIVELNAESLAKAIEGYFKQSVQRDTSVSIDIHRYKPEGKRRERWYAGGIMLQKTPTEGGTSLQLVPKDGDVDDMSIIPDVDAWNRAVVLLGTVKRDELVDPNTAPTDTLYRLFHEDGAAVFHAEKLKAYCRCSRHKIERFLVNVPEIDLKELMNDEGLIEVICQFCKTKEEFTLQELEEKQRD